MKFRAAPTFRVFLNGSVSQRVSEVSSLKLVGLR